MELLGLSIYIARPSKADRLIERVGDPLVIERMLRKFSPHPNMPGAPFTYGDRLYHSTGGNQVAWLIDRIASKPETKSATIGLLKPGDKSPHLPCLTTLDAKLRDGRLHLGFFFRSQNVFGRQYANLLALCALQETIARQCGADMGHLSGFVASAHIYAYDIPMAEQLIASQCPQIRDEYYERGPDAR